MPYNGWEVFDPNDGKPKFITDTEETAKQIAEDYGLDCAPEGKESNGRGGWIPWNESTNGD